MPEEIPLALLKEQYRRVTGIAISTKTSWQIVARGGDSKGIGIGDLDIDVEPRKPFAQRMNNGILVMSLYTHAMDNFGRNVNLGVGLKGLSTIDSSLAFPFFTNLFPNLTFQVFAERLVFDEISVLAEQNIVPYPPLH